MAWLLAIEAVDKGCNEFNEWRGDGDASRTA